MKLRSVLLLAALVLMPFRALAQEATPTPNGMVYDDAAMHFVAPTGFTPVAQRKVPVEDLGEDLMPVAGWIGGDRARPIRLLIQQAAFHGTLDGWEATFQQDARNVLSDASFKDKKSITLRNGMPAYFLQMTAGEGFQLTSTFTELWIDGQRGVAISLVSSVGDLDAAKAQALLSDVSAVRYPRDGP